MNSYDKYAEMMENEEWRYVDNELDNLNHEIKSRLRREKIHLCLVVC